MAVKAASEITVYDQTDAEAIVSWHRPTTGSVAPAAPTTTDASAIPSGWSRSEPTVSTDADLSKHDWTCLQLVWGDGTCSWGDVTMSASFEAAKVAYNKALSAAQTATSFVTELSDGIMVHPEGDATTGWSIRDAIELLKGGASYIKAWLDGTSAKVRVGLESAGHLLLTPSAAEVLTDASTSVASFGATSRIGKDDESHVELDYHSMQLIDKEGNTYFHVSDLRNAEGYATIVETFSGNGSMTRFSFTYSASSLNYSVTVDGTEAEDVTKNNGYVTFATAPAAGVTIVVTYDTTSADLKVYTLGTRNSRGKVGGYSVAEGFNVVASGIYTHAEGCNTRSEGKFSHAEGWSTTASGAGSHAEGYSAWASNLYSHAEGNDTTASGAYSHAEGHNTTTYDIGSHAEGVDTTANGVGSHAEGFGTAASGAGSHAQNRGTIAASESQTVLGRYNEEDANDTYALIIGNGTNYDARSNALTVDWSGNVWAAGKAALDGAIEAASATITSAISAASATISGLLTADRVKIASGGSKGLLTTDSTGFEYPLISDNGNNLWIGAHKAGEQHHTGGTYISAGAGRDTIYVSVPNSDNTAGTNYSVMHSGYAPVETSTISDIISAQSGATVSAATFAQWGKVAMLNVTYTLSSKISVPADGNTANTTLFTIAAGKRPVEYLGVLLDPNEGLWGHVTTGGVVTVDGANARSAAWTANTTNTRYLRCVYLLP